MTDVVSYTYRIDNGPETTVTASAGGTTTANIVTANLGSHRFNVWSTTSTGSKSGTASTSYTASDAPLVASTEYPDSQGGGGPGVTGVFTFTPAESGFYPIQVYSRTAGSTQSNLGRDYCIIVN